MELAKGNYDDESEMSSYASYDTVARGARKLASASEGPARRKDEIAGTTAAAQQAARRHGPVSSAQTNGINSMTLFIEETAHEDSRDDPDFNFAGLAYVFSLLFMGTQQWVNRLLQGKSVLRFFLLDALRRVGQAYFMNNPLSGLVILGVDRSSSLSSLCPFCQPCSLWPWGGC